MSGASSFRRQQPEDKAKPKRPRHEHELGDFLAGPSVASVGGAPDGKRVRKASLKAVETRDWGDEVLHGRNRKKRGTSKAPPPPPTVPEEASAVVSSETDELGIELKDFIFTVKGLVQLLEGGTAGDFLERRFVRARGQLHGRCCPEPEEGEEGGEEEEEEEEPPGRIYCRACPMSACRRCQSEALPKGLGWLCTGCRCKDQAEVEEATTRVRLETCRRMLNGDSTLEAAPMRKEEQLSEAVLANRLDDAKQLAGSTRAKTKSLPSERVGMNYLQLAVANASPNLVRDALQHGYNPASMTKGLGLTSKKSDVQVPVLFLAVASLLIRRSQDALDVLLMLSGHTKTRWDQEDWDGLGLVDFAKLLGAPDDVLQFIQLEGQHEIDLTALATLPDVPDTAPVAVVTDLDMAKNRTTPPGHPLGPENHVRLKVLVACGGILRCLAVASRALIIDKVAAAHPSIYSDSGVHEEEYVRLVLSICNQAEEPQRATVAIDEQDDGHVDTYVSRRSLMASLKEAGAVQEAVRRVTDRINRHVYILARAPGHHAAPGGAEDIGSCGFCLFNGTGLAAALARKTGKVKRIMIIDHDIHHGNGTKLVLDRLKAKGVLGEDEVAFVDVCAEGQVPCAGAPGGLAPFFPFPASEAETSTNMRVVPVPFKVGKPLAEGQYLEAYKTAVLEMASTFKPDLVVVSNGMDGHAKDTSVSPPGVGNMTTGDVASMAAIVYKICEDNGCGSIWFSEGGYGINGGAAGPLARSHLVTVLELAKSQGGEDWGQGGSV